MDNKYYRTECYIKAAKVGKASVYTKFLDDRGRIVLNFTAKLGESTHKVRVKRTGVITQCHAQGVVWVDGKLVHIRETSLSKGTRFDLQNPGVCGTLLEKGDTLSVSYHIGAYKDVCTY